MLSKAEVFLRLCWPANGFIVPMERVPAPLLCTQVRGKKQKFGGATRDPFKSLQRKLAREQQRRHAKVPLMSEERAQRERLAPITISSLGQVVATYAPLEKFAKAPMYTRLGLSQRWKAFTESLGTLYATAMIRRRLRKVDPFRPVEFAKATQQQFIDTNAALQRKDKHRLRELVTENAIDDLKGEFDNRRFVWELREQLERPRVVNAKIVPMETRDNYFAQVVVRIRSSQMLAVYNNAGKLLRGHPSNAKEVTDYVVMERHLRNPERGHRWRIAGKLPPQIPSRSLLTTQNELGSADKPNSLSTP